MPESPEITGQSGKLSDARAFVLAVPRTNDGGATLRLRFVGQRGGGRIEHAILDDAGRRRLIRALGGVPADADPAAAPYVEIDRTPVGAAVEPETHELYSWNERNRGWVAISQGTEDALTEQEAERYASARKRAIPGCAFWVGEIADGAPQLPPADLGVEVTTE